MLLHVTQKALQFFFFFFFFAFASNSKSFAFVFHFLVFVFFCLVSVFKIFCQKILSMFYLLLLYAHVTSSEDDMWNLTLQLLKDVHQIKNISTTTILVTIRLVRMGTYNEEHPPTKSHDPLLARSYKITWQVLYPLSLDSWLSDLTYH